MPSGIQRNQPKADSDKKIQEQTPKWDGHILRKIENANSKKSFDWNPAIGQILTMFYEYEAAHSDHPLLVSLDCQYLTYG